MINGKPLILAVDDEENIRNLITYTFEEHNLEVMTAENGKAAITILENNPIDVIITDLLMPTMTGLALIREMKKKKKRYSYYYNYRLWEYRNGKRDNSRRRF